MTTRIEQMAASLSSAPTDAVRDLARSAAEQLAEPNLRLRWTFETLEDAASWLCAANRVLLRREYLSLFGDFD